MAILLLDPSKSGRSLWVKKWISFLDWCDGGEAVGEGGGKRFFKLLISSGTGLGPGPGPCAN